MSHFFSRFAALAATAISFFLLSSLGDAQSYPPAWNSTATYAVGDQVQVGGNVYRAIKAVTSPGLSPLTFYAFWQLSLVQSSTTLMVGIGQTFPGLSDAWAYALNARVADGAYLHFYLSSANGDLDEVFTAPVLLDHGSGARMAILGDSAAHITLNFSSSGFIVDSGHSFNTISGVTLTNSNTGTTTDGLKIGAGSTVSAVANSTFVAFSNAIHAVQSGSVVVGSGIVLSSFRNAGLLAEYNASILCTSPITASGPGTFKPTYGIAALEGSQINAPGATLAQDNTGAYASMGAAINITGSTLSSCGTGAMADQSGIINMFNSTVVNNGDGVVVTRRSYVDARGLSMSSNQLDFDVEVESCANAAVTSFSTSYVDTYDSVLVT
jgi:hypothetical protein